MIIEIQMVYIGTMNFIQKNRSELVQISSMDRKSPVLGGPVRSPQYLGQS